MAKTIIKGTGCSLADILYTGIDFEGEEFARFRSRSAGDGGLVPGQLVFAREIERFAGLDVDEILSTVTRGAPPASRNLGGPAVVALINASQFLYDRREIEISFKGAAGDDDNGHFILSTIGATSLAIDDYKIVPGASPVTYVLSDPSFHDGHGERTFINNVAAAGSLAPADLDSTFFDGDILLFGATGLVPQLHDGLTELLERAKRGGSMTVVTTVYDFRSEKRSPLKRWLLGSSDESYRYIDLLVTDREEALRLSGGDSLAEAAEFFVRRGVGAFVITNGPDPVQFYARGGLFAPAEGSLPVSLRVSEELAGSGHHGDTTGCGDNFAGGMIASIALQMNRGSAGELDLPSACALGMVSGGFACFYLGGTFHEREAGEKRAAIVPFYESYRAQVADLARIIALDRLL